MLFLWTCVFMVSLGTCMLFMWTQIYFLYIPMCSWFFRNSYVVYMDSWVLPTHTLVSMVFKEHHCNVY